MTTATKPWITGYSGPIAYSADYKASDSIAMTRDWAETLHGDQTDKTGEPYVAHLDAVAANVQAILARAGNPSDPELVKAAYLHDVVEDTRATLKHIRDEDFSDRVVDVVDGMTKKSNQPNHEYIGKVLKSWDTSVVKLADLKHNTDPDRLKTLSEDVRVRLLRKYLPAIYRIETTHGFPQTVTLEQAVRAVAGYARRWGSLQASSLRSGDVVRLTEHGRVYTVKHLTLTGDDVRIRATSKDQLLLPKTSKVQYRLSSNTSTHDVAKYLGHASWEKFLAEHPKAGEWLCR